MFPALQFLSLFLTLSMAAASAQATGNNILIIIADDLGVDMLGMYGMSPNMPLTPNIDDLKANGVMFRNAWSNPYCSPTRATIQTGQFGFRTGVGYVTLPSNNNGLPLDQTLINPLPRVLNQNPELGYSHAAIGKWHLSNRASSRLNRMPYAPNDAGWSYFSGNWTYMGGYNVEGGRDDYFAWQKLENGQTTQIASSLSKDPKIYATTVNVDDSVTWINKQTGPWLLYLAFNSPHAPFHVPPEKLYCPDTLFSEKKCQRDLTDEFSENSEKYKAMIQAMDTEIGRLVSTLGPSVMAKTTVIFLGDNGTPDFNGSGRLKGSLYEGGIHIPLIISGADVKKPNRESSALVNTTDLYATVLDLAGVNLKSAFTGNKLDTISLKPIIDNTYNRSLRKFLYAELFNKNFDLSWTKAVRNERFKLIRKIPDKAQPDVNPSDADKYYDLTNDPFELCDLLASGNCGTLTVEGQRNLDDLRAQLDALATGTDKWALPGNIWFRNITDFLLD